ncbi:MAG: class I SAM-dependent methyltransferase [Candidatus Zixiibacteriota bacterium]|nr:MAG: class I SAM-dependent methyltransferase [candidate division Zixibacteria bacterium]
MEFSNAYEDAKRAEAYAKLEFPDTYYLAFRDLPEIISQHVNGKKAMDFGCGTGRSTRFIIELGFDSVGVDISADMLKKARELDPTGDYRLLGEGSFGQLQDEVFDLILSAFTFDNIPTREKKVGILKEIRRLLKPEGRFVNLVSSPEMYYHEWASFSTKDFPENRNAKCGDIVRIINTATDDRRPVDDILWPDEDYWAVYQDAGLAPIDMYKPLAREDEPYQWVNETRIAPWAIYVLKRTVR